MKYPLLSIIFLFTIHSIAQKNIKDDFEYKITYIQKAQLNKEDSTFVKTEDMILFIGKETSSFSSKGMATEQTYKIRGNSGHSINGVTEFLYIIIKNSKTKKMYYTRKILQDKFYYEQDLQAFNWEILPGTKTYKNYSCQKATTSFAGRDYVAWFTMDIPIPEGPYKFNGLPGLIVEIHDTQNQYSFKMVGFEKLQKKLKFNLNFKEFIKVNKAKLNEIIYEFTTDRLNYFRTHNTSNVTIEASPENEKKSSRMFKEWLDKRNNPIELD